MDSTLKTVRKTSFDLGGGVTRQNVLRICKISFILMQLAFVIILINLTANVKIIGDALKMNSP